MSRIRKKYVLKLIFRCMVLLFSIVLLIGKDSFLGGTFLGNSFNVMNGSNFFNVFSAEDFYNNFSVFHVMWIIWVISMLQQVIPVKNNLPLGSAKNFGNRYKTRARSYNHEALKEFTRNTTRKAYLRVFLIWIALTAVIGVLYYTGIIDNAWILVISVAFYVCDLICVLIFCPFRLLLGNRCCTTCRIFNWDHFMMFSPMIFVGGFFGISLFLLAVTSFMVWEICIMMHPERFWPQSNTCLKCSECTDKLCTHICEKNKNE